MSKLIENLTITAMCLFVCVVNICVDGGWLVSVITGLCTLLSAYVSWQSWKELKK